MKVTVEIKAKVGDTVYLVEEKENEPGVWEIWRDSIGWIELKPENGYTVMFGIESLCDARESKNVYLTPDEACCALLDMINNKVWEK